jgi:hypothetical protein
MQLFIYYYQQRKIIFFPKKITLEYDICGRTRWNQQSGWRNWRNGNVVAIRIGCRGGERKRSRRRCRTRRVQIDDYGKDR